MRIVIYYFTGTGNSLAAAKKIAAVLGGCEIVPIASLANTPGAIAPEAGRIGIVCPVYFSGLPAMVTAFAKRFDTAPRATSSWSSRTGEAEAPPSARRATSIWSMGDQSGTTATNSAAGASTSARPGLSRPGAEPRGGSATGTRM